MPLTLYAATTNPGKLRDFAYASGPEVEILPLPNLAAIPEPIEDAETFAGNAHIKALAYSAHAPGLIVLADDSGLELDALNGAPGVRSARYAQDSSYTIPNTLDSAALHKDALNNACLLANAARLTGDQRRARYRCVLIAARDGHLLATGEGSLEGLLLDHPRGTAGFGYDPIFLIEPLGLTMAELPPQTRLQYSHRARALSDLLPKLRGLQTTEIAQTRR